MAQVNNIAAVYPKDLLLLVSQAAQVIMAKPTLERKLLVVLPCKATKKVYLVASAADLAQALEHLSALERQKLTHCLLSQ